MNSSKADKISAMLEQMKGRVANEHDVHPSYAGYFDCFNRGLYYEAHDVLEHLWLPQRNGANGSFYKGLIQLAGAFVHLQKNRMGPAAALFKLARVNLQKYPARHEHLNLSEVLTMIEKWLGLLEGSSANPLTPESRPLLTLTPPNEAAS